MARKWQNKANAAMLKPLYQLFFFFLQCTNRALSPRFLFLLFSVASPFFFTRSHECSLDCIRFPPKSPEKTTGKIQNESVLR